MTENKNDKNTLVVGANSSKANKPNKPVEQKPQKKHYIQIEYEDTTRTIAKVVLEIDDYEYCYDYRMNIERCVEGMNEVGGFWLNKQTIIPFAKVYSINAYEMKEETQPQPPQNREQHKGNKGNKGRGRRRRSSQNGQAKVESGAVNLTEGKNE